MPTNADGTMGFRQNSDLFYLSGIDQEDTVLLLYPDHVEEKFREILFIKETNETIAIWEGDKLSKTQAREVSGITSIYWYHQFQNILNSLITEADNIYLNSNEHQRAQKIVETKDDRFTKWCKGKYPLFHYLRSAVILQEIRSFKSDIEIELIKTACGITEKGFRRILDFVRPGVMEYEIEAEFTHTFISNRSRGHAYEPIVASGVDSCVLHYTKNSKQCKNGDILLMDVGAEYANYASDMTRCIPVNGRFSPRQREVYSAVLRIMKEAIVMLVPGNTFHIYNVEMAKVIEHELIGLNLLSPREVKTQDKENPLYRKYFMHGISHFLGLDVHDVGNKYMPFGEGTLLTCEPGIYIREEGLGIRLENDILITKYGPEDLMKNIPIEADEIESLMNQ
jgi:Xaa-Pro aminopeptidase